jgi:hypothetical protein
MTDNSYDLNEPVALTTPPQQPQHTSQFVTREYIEQVLEIIGDECGLADAALSKKFDEKLESRIGAVEKMISKATEMLESRLRAIEARDEFAGKHSKRIITTRDERGNLVADVIERADGNPQGCVN